ncbi:hypothetical protein DSM104635_01799 [Terricaulis silvestris]|uniref:Uncharacterized protein n=1 Tax=Terricaulis silvestris TaxID=2686094 RepID=A0A6I6MQJ0_9CAUL|nr:hypothetical protein DSM104635_01799 [Terricaulis silvestris]
MLHRVERTALHYDVGVGSSPAHAPAQSLLTIIRAVAELSSKGEAIWRRNKGKSVIRIARVRIHNNGSRAVLLFQHSDRDAADPSFSELVTGETRTEQKGLGEGVAVSAHMVIDLTPSARNPHVYQAVLEHVPGLTKYYVEQALQSVVRKVAGYRFADINGLSGQAYPVLSFSTRLQESLFAEVAKGQLNQIVFIRHEQLGDGFDNEPAVLPKEETYRLQAVAERSGKGVVALMNRLIKSGRDKGYTSAKFVFTNEDGKTKQPTFDISRAENFEAFVAKASQFEVEDDLAQCEAEIRADVSRKLDALLQRHVAGLAA